MSTLEQHAALDALVRSIQQAQPANPSPELVAILARASEANDSGVDVEAALVALQSASTPATAESPAEPAPKRRGRAVAAEPEA